MYLDRLTAANFRQFGDGKDRLAIQFNKGLTALVGRNDSGKSAVIDAIRYALLTRDQAFIRPELEDFHVSGGSQADEITICCELRGLNDEEMSAFVEYLTYEEEGVALMVTWTAKRRSSSPSVRRWVDVAVRSGRDGTGPAFEGSVRDLLATTYLRPLRDAAREMSAGRGSRLSQILSQVDEIKSGEGHSNSIPDDIAKVGEYLGKLGLLGLADFFGELMGKHTAIKSTERWLNDDYMKNLVLDDERIRGKIGLVESGSDALRLRKILERLELGIAEGQADGTTGRYGHGSTNLLYIACELLLLGREDEGLPLLLIEEPEAHLHPQRQLRLVDFLSRAATAGDRSVQVIVSTHSPNLASTVPLESIVMMDDSRAFSLAPSATALNSSDYRFLQRFLDVTKANLFFAHGVIIVEGIAEALLIPAISKALGIDLTARGVSIVDVGGTGLGRFGRIFQRRSKTEQLSIRVACITDADIMPDCAPEILCLVTGEDDAKWEDSKRRWRAERDGKRQELKERSCSSDCEVVKTFVSEKWTFEYDLAFCGLAKEVHRAVLLAKQDDAILSGTKSKEDVTEKADEAFETLSGKHQNPDVLCTHIYKHLHGGVSKGVCAQYLAEIIEGMASDPKFDREQFVQQVPPYLVEAIRHASHVPESDGVEI